MPIEADIACCLGDLEDEGLDCALDVIQGELGAAGIRIPLACPPVDAFRPRAGIEPRWFHSAGGLQFQPDVQYSRGTRAKPVVAEWLRKRNPLARLAETCHGRDLALHGRITCCHSPATIAHNPTLAVKDVFGSMSPTWLCPANLDVHAYLSAIVEDVTRTYAVATIEIDAYAFPDWRAARAHGRIGFDPGAVGTLLLSLCFCESCRQLAARDGIDVAAAERFTRTDLDAICRAGGASDAQNLDDYLERRQPISHLLTWRADRIIELVGRLQEASAAPLAARRPENTVITGADATRVASRCAIMTVPLARSDEAAMEQLVACALTETGAADRIHPILDASNDVTPDAAALVRTVGRAAALGVVGVTLGEYGLTPPERLGWLQQAIRYGRRGA
ncbi:MAG: hypothetical protein JXA69_17860 [Phycisphaerae bacterium]|nr:hypothetical protein [Phycisphaerae bacterium]